MVGDKRGRKFQLMFSFCNTLFSITWLPKRQGCKMKEGDAERKRHLKMVNEMRVRPSDLMKG